MPRLSLVDAKSHPIAEGAADAAARAIRNCHEISFRALSVLEEIVDLTIQRAYKKSIKSRSIPKTISPRAGYMLRPSSLSTKHQQHQSNGGIHTRREEQSRPLAEEK